MKRHRVAEWIKKYKTQQYAAWRDSFSFRDTHTQIYIHLHKEKGWENIFHVNSRQKKAGEAMLLLLCSQIVLVVKNPPANGGDIRDASTIPGSGRCPGGGHGKPLQYSCLENPMDKELGRLQFIGSHRVKCYFT